MTAEAAIHDFWGSYKPLSDLVPADRIYTGLPPIQDENLTAIARPYVGLLVQGESQTERTSDGQVLKGEHIRFMVYTDSYDQGRTIDQMILDIFNRADFTYSGGRVLDMKPENRVETEDPDTAVWLIDRGFFVRTVELQPVAFVT